tara:strand:- start:363 stop:590 length:228 start_codon:yes stop_codon:yes gene_type:complete
MSHKVNITIPNDCTVEQFEGLLKDNGMSYEDTKYKTERIEKDLESLKGKTVLAFSDKDHIFESYQYNKQVTRENE